MSERADSSLCLDSRWMDAARWIWIPTAILAVGILIASIPGYLQPLGWDLPPGSSDEQLGSLALASLVFGRLASIGSSVLSISLAAILYWRRRNDRMALLVSYFLLIFGATFAGPAERLESMLTGRTDVTLAASALLLIVPMVLIFSLFPSGHFVPRWTRWLSLGSVFWVPVYFAVSPTSPTPTSLQTTYIASLVWILVIIAPMLYAQFHRYRNVSTPAERQQTKWVIYGFGIWLVLTFLSSIPYMRAVSQPAEAPAPASVVGLGLLWWFTQAILPVSLAFALLRYRLWEIDQIINRTLVYSTLTVILALVYLLSVVLLQVLFRGLTGQDSPFAIVISTLAIAALFNPLRQRIQVLIDHRFYRSRYDASRALSSLSEGMRNRVDLADISQILLAAVDDTLQPQTLALWLREADRKR